MAKGQQRMTAAAPKLTEKQVTDQCIQWLRSQRWVCERVQSGLMVTKDGRRMRVGSPGALDWNCFQGPRYFKLELKRPGKRPTVDQEIYMALAAQRGMPCIWADSLDMLMEKIKGLCPQSTPPI